MRFLVDECTGSTVAEFIKQKGYEVISVFDEFRGATDDFLLEKCVSENYILITSDKDFGEMVFRLKQHQKGIILVRCLPNNFQNRIEVLSKLLQNYNHLIQNNFIVVTNNKVRVIT